MVYTSPNWFIGPSVTTEEVFDAFDYMYNYGPNSNTVKQRFNDWLDTVTRDVSLEAFHQAMDEVFPEASTDEATTQVEFLRALGFKVI